MSSISYAALSALRCLMIVRAMINDDTQSLDQFCYGECNKIADSLIKLMITTFIK